MAKRKKKKKGGGLKKRFALFFLAAFVAAGMWGVVNAHIVHLDYVDVYIKDLSPFLEGTTVLFASDFKFRNESGAARAVSAMKRLCRANPDIILLGGDYAAYSLSDALKLQTREGRDAVLNRLSAARRAFFIGMSEIYAPGGIFAVSGDADSDVPGLWEDCRVGNVILLENSIACTSLNGTNVYVAGYRDYLTGGDQNYRFSGPGASDAVLAFSHNPDSCKRIATVNDNSGSPLADLILCGHTLGGQISFRGKSLMTRAGVYGGEFPAGLYDETLTRVKTLVSSGVGTEWLPVRLGSRAQAYLVTLHLK